MIFWCLLQYTAYKKKSSYSSLSNLFMLLPVSLFYSCKLFRTKDWILGWRSKNSIQLLLILMWRNIFFGIMAVSRRQLIYLLYMSNKVKMYKNHIHCYADRCCPILLDSGDLSFSHLSAHTLTLPFSKHLFSSWDDDHKNFFNVVTELLG